MGRISVLKPEDKSRQGPGKDGPRDLIMRFDENRGELNIKVDVLSEQDKNLAFIVNKIEYTVPIERNGAGVMSFEKSSPTVLYCVKVKDATAYKNDMRLGFWY